MKKSVVKITSVGAVIVLVGYMTNKEMANF